VVDQRICFATRSSLRASTIVQGNNTTSTTTRCTSPGVQECVVRDYEDAVHQEHRDCRDTGHEYVPGEAAPPGVGFGHDKDKK
jgi:hypothetical protein